MNISDDPLNFYSAPIASSVIDESATTFALDVETVCFHPRVQLVHDMLKQSEADHLLSLGNAARASNPPSSSTPLFTHTLDAQDPTVARILARLAHAAMVSVDTFGSVRLERHAPTTTPAAAPVATHMDILDLDDYDTIVSAASRGGQRFATIRVFLNEVRDGGLLHFPAADCSSLATSISSSQRVDPAPGEMNPLPQDVPTDGLAILPAVRLGVLYHVLAPNGKVERRSAYRQTPVQGSDAMWQLVVHIHEAKVSEGVPRLFKQLERVARTREQVPQDDDHVVVELD
eukprot:CAMPEP_0170741992 /NCGR_PEP_ID=MMETSP0437-20130122/6510_1 /TAXON_ID=0 /ORGANISM="Sexangularia sp." /LENGTH=287 /DNA_ID=CAMNT_0011080591 /DNA_START=209 /DNA_END=1072 /DNA_ORIENTATION=+